MPEKIACYCAALRQASRAISQKYDAVLRTVQLTGTQFTLLTALSQRDRPRVSELAEALSMDQTTLSRTLGVMQREGLIAAAAGGDRRESRWMLTARGEDRRRRALPLWNAAQQDVEKLLGKRNAKRIRAAVFELATRLAP